MIPTYLKNHTLFDGHDGEEGEEAAGHSAYSAAEGLDSPYCCLVALILNTLRGVHHRERDHLRIIIVKSQNYTLLNLGVG